MDFRKATVTALFLSGLAITTGQARAADLDACTGSSLAIAQCECNMALSIGTPSALKKFLKHYASKGTACAATASTSGRPSQSGGGNGGGSNGGGGSSTGGGGNGGSGGDGDDGAPKPPSVPDNPNDGTDSPPDGSGNVPKGG